MIRSKNEVVTMLDDWGSYMRGQVDIGYPKTNILAKANETYGEPPEASEDVKHIERVVLTMQPSIKKVIKHKFIYRLTQEESASYLKISRRVVRARLDSAIDYVAGSLINFK